MFVIVSTKMGEQGGSGNRNNNDQGRGSSQGSQSRNFSGGRGRGDYHKKNNDNHANRKNDVNSKNNDDNNDGNNTSQSKIKCSTKDFKGGTKESEDHHYDAAVSNQADVCALTTEAVIDHCGESSQMGPNVATSLKNLEAVKTEQLFCHQGPVHSHNCTKA